MTPKQRLDFVQNELKDLETKVNVLLMAFEKEYDLDGLVVERKKTGYRVWLSVELTRFEKSEVVTTKWRKHL